VTTFGGHPVSCAAGLAGLDILVRERLAERAFWGGRRLREGLDRLVGIGAVAEARGIGLMLGLRFESADATRRFVELTLAKGLLLGWTLHCDDLVRITPPLILTDDEIDLALARIREAVLEGNA
jgi:4-aminobutyrate aminotransferase-like enzyme